ncbi:hypothetical protein M513_07219 [Trichuris suis]|uniref:HTH psq-type domain-containing protein n=1 Tax=Trichuris suis TaxID=68888 RepID=A0A085M3U4_9BILA|nr:hypothetical protein M513_07219 [Trichuris suis]
MLKRKHIALTIEKKEEIIEALKRGETGQSLSERYGVGTSTISDIGKNAARILEYSKKQREEGGSSEPKRMRASKNEEVMEAAYGEKLSADTLSADNFTGELKELLEREHYDEDFVYSADETGLNWRALPTRTLATHAESTVPGFKAAKDRVTLMVCANSTGTHRLPLFLIGKSKRPGAIGRAKKLLAVYSHQKRAWMNTETFTYWLKNVFVPEVRGFQNSIRRSGKVLLLIDNAPAHAASAQLNSLHEDVTVHFLPPNVTPIQLMHQGVIRSLKVHYRRRLLEQLLCSDNFAAKSAPDFYKMVDLRDCCYLAAESWEAIKQSTRLEIKDLVTAFSNFMSMLFYGKF